MPRPTDIHLSVVVPAYNEAGRIERSLERLTDYLDRQTYKSEVLVVADGSRDQTLPRVSRSSLWRPYINALDNRVDRGAGAAVRRGMLSANGELLLYVHPQLGTSIGHLDHLRDAIEAGADVAIASRRLADSELTGPRPWWSRAGAAAFAGAARAAVVPGISDPIGGFTLFRRAAALDIFPRQRIRRHAFEVELIRIARRLGYRVAEVPASWSYQPPGRFRPFADSLRMTVDLARIWYYDRRGFYTASPPLDPETPLPDGE